MQRTRGPVSETDGNGALLRLAEHADELVDCLQSLKVQLLQRPDRTGRQLGEIKKRISRLSKHLTPSFEALASISESEASYGAGSTAPQNAAVSEDQSRAASGVPVPPMTLITSWASSEIKAERPPLPRMIDPDLVDEAFTHPGVGGKRQYERLEWLGDAYLELIATALIHQTFGKLPVGRCSQLRERLVRNVNLAEYFRHYGMPKWAKLPDDLNDGRGLGRGRSSDKDLLKTQADMFEAYVAAMILSDAQNGLSNVTDWLKALWGKTIEEDIKAAEEARSDKQAEPRTTSSSPKERLSQLIVVKGIVIRYKDIPGTKREKNLGLPLYSVGAYLDGWGETGSLLAVGTALNKKEAGQKAAEAVLQNKKLLKGYEEKKRAYLRVREAATEM